MADYSATSTPAEDVYRQAFLAKQEQKRKAATPRIASQLMKRGLFESPISQYAYGKMEEQISGETADFEAALGLQKEKEEQQAEAVAKEQEFTSGEAVKGRAWASAESATQRQWQENYQATQNAWQDAQDDKERAFVLKELKKQEREARRKGWLGALGSVVDVGVSLLSKGKVDTNIFSNIFSNIF